MPNKVKPQVITGWGTGPNYTAGETPWFKDGGNVKKDDSQNGPSGLGYQDGGELSKKEKRKAEKEKKKKYKRKKTIRANF